MFGFIFGLWDQLCLICAVQVAAFASAASITISAAPISLNNWTFMINLITNTIIPHSPSTSPNTSSVHPPRSPPLKWLTACWWNVKRLDSGFDYILLASARSHIKYVACLLPCCCLLPNQYWWEQRNHQEHSSSPQHPQRHKAQKPLQRLLKLLMSRTSPQHMIVILE